MKRSVKDIGAAVQAQLRGDGGVQIFRVASIALAGAGDLVFAEKEDDLAEALESRASAVIAGQFAAEITSSKPILVCAHPKLAFARAAKFLRQETKAAGVHPSAVVHASARLGEGVHVAERAVIGEGAEIGAGSHIGAGTVVAPGVVIGRDCELYPNVTIYAGSRLGDRVTIHAGAVLGSDGFGYVRDGASGRYEKFPQIGQLEIGDDVEIGANTTIDRGALEVTRIGRGAKIDNLVHIGHNCQIGENVVIAAQTGLSGSIVVDKNVVMGGQVGIGEHAHIEEGVMLGGQSGVLPGKVLRGKGVALWGTPARPLKEYLRSIAALARLGKRSR